MTDPHDPLDTPPPDADDALDALASAHVDGRTTDAEATRIAGDADISARVTAMEAVRAALRADVPPATDAQREQAIETALAAFDEQSDGAAPADASVGPVVAIDALSARRATGRRRLQLLGAAAAVAVVAFLVPLLSKLGSDDHADDLATAAHDEAGGGTTAERQVTEDATAGVAAAPAPATAFAGAAPTDLGAFDDLAALTSSVQDLVERGAATELAPTTTGGGAADATTSATTSAGTGAAAGDCDGAPGIPPPDAGPTVLLGIAVIGDRPVAIAVYEVTGGRRLLVIDPTDCSIVASAAL